MKSISIKYLILLLSVPFLEGCYCFLEGSSQNVRYLDGTKFHPLCEWRLDGLVKQVNAYYGFPGTDLPKYRSDYFDSDNVSSKEMLVL